MKCQQKYPPRGLNKQQNSSGRLSYLMLFHFLILLYLNTDVCLLGMGRQFHWCGMKSWSFFFFLLWLSSRVWTAFSLLLLITHKRGAPKNTGEISDSLHITSALLYRLYKGKIASHSADIQVGMEYLCVKWSTLDLDVIIKCKNKRKSRTLH